MFPPGAKRAWVVVFTIDQCSKPLVFFIRLVSHMSSWGDPRTSHTYIYRINFLVTGRNRIEYAYAI